MEAVNVSKEEVFDALVDEADLDGLVITSQAAIARRLGATQSMVNRRVLAMIDEGKLTLVSRNGIKTNLLSLQIVDF